MTTIAETTARRVSSTRWDRPVRLTPLYHEHLALGATMTERDGWLLSQSYGDRSRELATLHDAAGLLDRSEQTKIDLKGDGIDALLRAVFPAMESVEVGRSATGVDDALVYRLTDEEALVITSPDVGVRTLHTLSSAAGEHRCVHVVDLTGSLCGLHLLGPQAPAVLQRVSALDLAPDRFAAGAVVQGAVAKVHAVVARRDTAELIGYDLYVDRDLGAYLWDTLLEIGAPLALRPVGREAEEELN